MKRFAFLVLPLALCACSSSSASRRQEVTIATSEKAQDILGMNLLLFDLKDRRESTGLRAWSFKVRNTEKEIVDLRVTPLFIAADKRELGGSAFVQSAPIDPGREHEFYIQAPNGEAVRLIVTFDLK